MVADVSKTNDKPSLVARTSLESPREASPASLRAEQKEIVQFRRGRRETIARRALTNLVSLRDRHAPSGVCLSNSLVRTSPLALKPQRLYVAVRDICNNAIGLRRLSGSVR
ncbi:hypothetical protein Y032_0168g174 [Ancylostoma ceylanicum]|uniref:Uncharacterized protein n=1 Tax=Ancylostoma ceylanicum TaxID=53326 RepID=A0A016SVY4_9BILA|nr:hypothetical protein Y032_0168g174 [Ancylostoma ceylanicum]